MSADQNGPPFREPNLKMVRIDEFTADQLAMLELLGGNPATVERVVHQFYVGGIDQGAKVIGSRPAHIIHERSCPRILWRGRWRVVMPNGDISASSMGPGEF